MAPAPGTHTLGPSDGSIEVHTFREGIAQKAGHDLIIDVGQWQATVEVDSEGALASVGLEIDSRSLQVRDGLHGVKPLSDKDRADIKKTIDEKVLRGQPIAFRSSQVQSSGGGLGVRGELTIVGAARPADFQLAVEDSGRVSGTAQVTQTAWGIKPYKGLMGALKVRDAVEIAIDVRLPAG